MLRQKRFMSPEGWRLAKDRIADSKEAFLIVDDSLHASAANLKLIHQRRGTFFATLKSNRLVS